MKETLIELRKAMQTDFRRDLPYFCNAMSYELGFGYDRRESVLYFLKPFALELGLDEDEFEQGGAWLPVNYNNPQWSPEQYLQWKIQILDKAIESFNQ